MNRMFVALLAAVSLSVIAQTGSNSVAVTADNFTRAETDRYFANIVKEAAAPAGSSNPREIEPVDKQIVIRGNRDTIYSAAVFDLDAGPVTVTLPDAGKRFRSVHGPTNRWISLGRRTTLGR